LNPSRFILSGNWPSAFRKPPPVPGQHLADDEGFP